MTVLHCDCGGVLGVLRRLCGWKLFLCERPRRNLRFALWFRTVLHSDCGGILGVLRWLCGG